MLISQNMIKKAKIKKNHIGRIEGGRRSQGLARDAWASWRRVHLLVIEAARGRSIACSTLLV
jgi:hypothetical protein